MRLYKKIKKEFIPIDDLQNVKVGDIVKLKSEKDNKYITDASFVIKVNKNEITLQSSKSNFVFDGSRCYSLGK